MSGEIGEFFRTGGMWCGGNLDLMKKSHEFRTFMMKFLAFEQIFVLKKTVKLQKS